VESSCNIETASRSCSYVLSLLLIIEQLFVVCSYALVCIIGCNFVQIFNAVRTIFLIQLS